MNGTYMAQQLGMRLNSSDPDRPDTGKFTDAMKTRALNNAILALPSKINHNYLTSLQVVEQSLTTTGGVFELSSLKYNVLRGAQGILLVKINGGLYCTMTNITQRKRDEFIHLKGSAYNPLCWVYDEKIEVRAGVTSPVIDVYYLKEPNKIFYKINVSATTSASPTTFQGDAGQGLAHIDNTPYVGAVIYSVARAKYYVVTGYDATGGADEYLFTVADWDSSSVNWGTDVIYFLSNWWDTLNIKPTTTDPDQYLETCEIDPALHHIIVTMAEEECWAMDNQSQRRDAANEVASTQIKALNAMFKPAAGVGTTGVKREG